MLTMCFKGDTYAYNVFQRRYVCLQCVSNEIRMLTMCFKGDTYAYNVFQMRYVCLQCVSKEIPWRPQVSIHSTAWCSHRRMICSPEERPGTCNDPMGSGTL